MSVRTVLCCQNMFMLNLKWLNICSALEFPNFSGSDSVIDDWSNWCSTDIDSYLPTTVTNVFCSAVDITERANFAWRASSFMNYISDFTIVNYEFCSWYNWKSKLSLCTMFFFFWFFLDYCSLEFGTLALTLTCSSIFTYVSYSSKFLY